MFGRLDLASYSMRKFLTCLFVCFYFLLSIGATANLHFCKAGLKSFSFYSTKTVSCCKAKLKGKKCKFCKDVRIVLKKSGPEKIYTQQNTPAPTVAILSFGEPIFVSVSDLFKDPGIDRNVLCHSPPDIHCPPIHIQHCNFRI